MSQRGRVESRPYAGPDRPERQPFSDPPQRVHPTPSRPFAPVPGPEVASVGGALQPPPPPSRVRGDDRTSYEEWGPGTAAQVGGGAAGTPWPTPPPASDPRDAVATALETVALRVRTGELEPLGFVPGMGDAAAVSTALTALLTARP